MMRWSQALLNTLRDAPQDAEIVSHKSSHPSRLIQSPCLSFVMKAFFKRKEKRQIPQE